MSIPALAGQHLPPGRHCCTESEVEQAFVTAAAYSGSSSRQVLWDDWVKARILLTSAIKVHAAWISGSFTSTKVNPGDIDVTYIVSARDRAKRPIADIKVVESFQRRVPHPITGDPVPAHGLKVDSYIIDWDAFNLTPSGDMLRGHELWALNRGYWDDWWSRVRVTPKPLPAKRVDALPTRGYLEVNFDAYA